MKRITVYADFDFLAAPLEIGTLGYERVRGKDHFVFEYSREWLKQHGWTLSPAYDINPGTKMHQCILIDQYTEQSDAGILLQSSSRYMLEKNEAMGIIEEVRNTIKDWRKTATELQISHKIFEPYCNRWDSL